MPPTEQSNSYLSDVEWRKLILGMKILNIRLKKVYHSFLRTITTIRILIVSHFSWSYTMIGQNKLQLFQTLSWNPETRGFDLFPLIFFSCWLTSWSRTVYVYIHSILIPYFKKWPSFYLGTIKYSSEEKISNIHPTKNSKLAVNKSYSVQIITTHSSK